MGSSEIRTRVACVRCEYDTTMSHAVMINVDAIKLKYVNKSLGVLGSARCSLLPMRYWRILAYC